jgi:hypothetical protein
MMIYHKLDKARKSKQVNGDAFVMSLPQLVAISSGDRGVLSSVTLSSSSPPAPTAVLKKARSTITAVQLHHAEAHQKKKAHNAAFKYAKIIYD